MPASTNGAPRPTRSTASSSAGDKRKSNDEPPAEQHRKKTKVTPPSSAAAPASTHRGTKTNNSNSPMAVGPVSIDEEESEQHDQANGTSAADASNTTNGTAAANGNGNGNGDAAATEMNGDAHVVDTTSADAKSPTTTVAGSSSAPTSTARARRGAAAVASVTEQTPVSAEAGPSTQHNGRNAPDHAESSGAAAAAAAATASGNGNASESPVKRTRRRRRSGAGAAATTTEDDAPARSASQVPSVYDEEDDAEDDEFVDDLISEGDFDMDVEGPLDADTTQEDADGANGGAEEDELDEEGDELGGEEDEEEDEEEGVNWEAEEGEDELEEDDEDEVPDGRRRSRRAAANAAKAKKAAAAAAATSTTDAEAGANGDADAAAPSSSSAPKTTRAKGKAKAQDTTTTNDGDSEKTPSEKSRRSPKPKQAPRAIRQLPIAAPRNRWGRTQADVDNDLRSLLDTEAKANDYLASKWIDAKELHRLEGLGLIKYKRGKWTEAERTAMREHIKGFQEETKLADSELLEVLMCKGRYASRSSYPHFWAELSAKVPGRPVKYVVPAVQRMYDPRARKGAWTQDEDTALLSAYEKYPNEWTKISDIVERTVHDCRDRWKCELRDKDRRNTGPWTEEETEKLKDAVAKANEQMGLEPLSADTPWDVVVGFMGSTRTRTQCRKKWQDTMGYGHRATPEPKKRGPRLDPRVLLARMRELGIKHESDVQHSVVMMPEWGLTPAQLRRKWHHLKNTVSDREGMTFDVLLDKIEENLPTPKEPKKKRALAKGKKNAAASDAGKDVDGGEVEGGAAAPEAAPEVSVASVADAEQMVYAGMGELDPAMVGGVVAAVAGPLVGGLEGEGGIIA